MRSIFAAAATAAVTAAAAATAAAADAANAELRNHYESDLHITAATQFQRPRPQVHGPTARAGLANQVRQYEKPHSVPPGTAPPKSGTASNGCGGTKSDRRDRGMGRWRTSPP